MFSETQLQIVWTFEASGEVSGPGKMVASNDVSRLQEKRYESL